MMHPLRTGLPKVIRDMKDGMKTLKDKMEERSDYQKMMEDRTMDLKTGQGLLHDHIVRNEKQRKIDERELRRQINKNKKMHKWAYTGAGATAAYVLTLAASGVRDMFTRQPARWEEPRITRAVERNSIVSFVVILTILTFFERF